MQARLLKINLIFLAFAALTGSQARAVCVEPPAVFLPGGLADAVAVTALFEPTRMLKIDTPGMPKTYLLEVGRSEGLPAAIIATGQITVEAGMQGGMTIKEMVRAHGAVESSRNSLRFSTIVDVDVARLALGDGSALVALARGAVRILGVTNLFFGSVEFAGGLFYEKRVDAGRVYRYGVVGGPELSFSPGQHGLSRAFSGALHGSFELLFR